MSRVVQMAVIWLRWIDTGPSPFAADLGVNGWVSRLQLDIAIAGSLYQDGTEEATCSFLETWR